MMGPDASDPLVWREVTDALVAGVIHDLNDRLSALVGLAHILRLDAPPDAPLPAALTDEVARLERTVDLLRHYPRGPDGAAHAALLSEVLPPLVRLARRASGMDEIEIETTSEDDVPPAVLEWTSFARAVLTRLAAAADEARSAGSGRVRVHTASEGGEVVVRIAAGDAAEAEGVDDGGTADEWTLRLPAVSAAARPPA